MASCFNLLSADALTFAAPDNEADRLAALHGLALLDTEPEAEFDALVALAAEALDCPTALINLVDRDRVWVKAASRPTPAAFPRGTAFCDVTVRNDAMTVFDDLSREPRFAQHPMVIGAGLRFYAGAPIRVADDAGELRTVGTLCVLGEVARPLGQAGRRTLRRLAKLAEALLAARGATRRAVKIAQRCAEQSVELARKERLFRQTEQLAMVGSWRLSLDDEALVWSDNVYRIYGLPLDSPPQLAGALDHYPPEARGRVAATLASAIETGEAFDFEEEFYTARADRRRVRCTGEVEVVDGRPAALIGVFQDVTRRHDLECALRRSADTDALTGLSNRAAFERLLESAMTRAAKTGDPLLLALVDLDGFKAINDTLGHMTGDDVLREVGRLLRAPWLGNAPAARLGGDEFAVIFEGRAAGTAMLERLQDGLRVPVGGAGMTMFAAGSVGGSVYEPGLSMREFIHRADMALYTAKRARLGDRRRGDRRAD